MPPPSQESQGYGHSCRIHVRRANVFQDSFFNLNSRQAEELKGRLRVVFKREEGVDAGGLTREWFLVLSKEMFDPNYALFIPSAEGMTYQPNGLSSINSVHLNYFKFVGRVVGMAVSLPPLCAVRQCVPGSDQGKPHGHKQCRALGNPASLCPFREGHVRPVAGPKLLEPKNAFSARNQKIPKASCF